MKHTLLTLILSTFALAGGAQTLVVNEVMAANLGEALDPSYNFGGWIELYNPGSSSVSLSGMTLTDHKGRTHKLTSKHGSVAAKGYKCLWFGHYGSDTAPDGKSPTSQGKARYEAQIPFKLDCDGGTLSITKNGSELASVTYPAAIARCSWARTSDGGSEWQYCSWPTPACTNRDASFATERLAAPQPSHAGGKIEGTLSFDVRVPEGAQLYYTTDGSVPTLESAHLTPDASGSVALTATPGSFYKMRSMADGYLPSEVVTRTFLPTKVTISVGEDWTWDEDRWEWVVTPAGQYEVPLNGFHILSVTTDPRYLYDQTLGIYTQGTYGGWSYWGYGNYFEDWDRPVNVEIFSPEGEALMNQEMDMCISGGMSRTRELKSFKLKSDRIYEGQKFMAMAALFPDKPYQRYKDVMVRTGGDNLFMRHLDNALQTIAQRSGLYLDCQAYRPVYVLLNGQLLDILLLREPTNKQYGYSNYGMDTDYMDTLEESDITGVTVANGSRDAYSELLSSAASCATSESAWERVRELLDVDEFANYFAVETYLDNKDWPQNNIKFFREQTAAESADAEGTGRFHVVLQDLDWTFGDAERNTFSKIEEGAQYMYAVAGYQENPMVKLFLNLMKREEFRKRFVDSFCLVAGSVYDPAWVSTVVASIYKEMQDGYPADMQADLRAQLESLNSYLGSSWQNSRINYLRRWQRASASTTDAIMATIGSDDPAARIMLNDMPVPRNAFSGTLFLPITLSAESHSGRRFVGWARNGAIVSTACRYSITQGGNYVAQFADDEAHTASVVINEVGAANGIYQSERLKRSDWVELYNCTDQPQSLEGYVLSDGSGKAATLSGAIPAYGYRVMWADGEELPFKLANSDNVVLTLSDAFGNEVNRFFYHQHTAQQSVGRWPDGGENIYCFDKPSIASANFLTSYAAHLEYTPPTGLSPQLFIPNSPHFRPFDLQGRPTGANAQVGIVVERAQKRLTR